MFEAIDWKIFLLLLTAGFLGLLSVLPLNRSVLELTGKQGESETGGFSRRTARLLNFGTMLAILAAAIWGGLILSAQLKSVGAPLIESMLRGTSVPDLWRTATIPIMAGLVLGAILSLSAFHEPKETHLGFYTIPIGRRLLAGLFHGGIVEEIFFRWFLLLFLAWALSFIPGLAAAPISDEIFWAANIISALLFGLAHLPGSAAMAPLTKVSIALTILLNAIAGLVYGYLFWQSGFEAAMLAHMGTHIALQPCAPRLLRWRRDNGAPNNAPQSMSLRMRRRG